MVDFGLFEDATNSVLAYGQNVGRGPNQIKWPTIEPFYRGLDTQSADLGDHDAPKQTVGTPSEQKTIPWISLDDLHHNRSVFSLTTPFKKETLAFFSERNYSLLWQAVSRAAGSINFDERLLQKSMIDWYQMKTPRMDQLDERTYHDDPATTASYVNELNVIVVRDVVYRVIQAQRQAHAFQSFRSGPAFEIPLPMDTRTRDIGSSFNMADYELDMDRSARVSPAESMKSLSRSGFANRNLS